MIQQALQKNVISSETTHETHFGFGISRLSITILKGVFNILRTIVSIAGEGFYIFDANAEYHHLLQNRW